MTAPKQTAISLTDSISKLAEDLNRKTSEIIDSYALVENGRIDAAEYFVDHFDSGCAERICTFRNLYANFYAEVGINSRQELDQCRRQLPDSNGMLNAIEKLRTVERQWEEFLDKVDQHLNCIYENTRPSFVDFDKIYLTDCGNGRRLSLKSCLSNKISGKYALLVIMRFYGCPYSSVHIQELSEFAQKFEQKLCNIIIVCKGSLEGGQSWVKKSGVQFPLLADDQSQFIRNFSFRRSAKSLLGPEGIDATLRARAKYGTLSLVPDPLTDLFQLGGDMIVNKQGEVIFFYHSGSVDDRPPASELLAKVPEH